MPAEEFTSRPYRVEADHAAALDLLLTWRAAWPARLGRPPDVWRLDQLLATRLWAPERDARVWVDGAGRLVALALLWARGPASSRLGLEAFARPGRSAAATLEAALAWATERAAERARELGQAVAVGASVYDDEPEQAARLERHGFTRAPGYNATMARWLDDLPTPPPLPGGYTLRAATEGDQAPYTALYDTVFAPMTPAHRARLLREPDYLHLVALAPGGAFVAFCELSFSQAEWALGGPRYGWVDYLGTLEAHQRRGLGRALLLAGLGRLRAAGAERVALITMGGNAQARSVYTHAGFYLAERDATYTRTFSG